MADCATTRDMAAGAAHREGQLVTECCRGRGLLPHSTDLGAIFPDGEEDRISALTDDILLRILACLGCARAAAHTGLLARRWRGLWRHLPAFTFHRIAPGPLEAALALIARPAPSLLDIHLSNPHAVEPARVSSLLGAVAALAPAEIAIDVNGGLLGGPVELPCFDRTTSIKLDLYLVSFTSPTARGFPDFESLTLPPAGGFRALETLHLPYGRIDLGDLLPRCPRLRKLLLHPFWNSDSIVVRSQSLEEFSVQANLTIVQLEIVAPALKRLYMDATNGIHKGCDVVLAAPAVEDLTWKCKCQVLTYRFGRVPWHMSSLTFERTQLANDIHGQSVCLQSQHCPRLGVLSLSLETNVLSGLVVSKTFKKEIYRFQVTDYSVLELDLIQHGHVYGAVVLHLLGLCTSIQRLKVTLDDRGDSCNANCRCDHQPDNWRSQSILLIYLKEVEIQRFRGQDHEIDLLKVLLRCATELERVALRFSGKVSSSDSACMKMVGILEDYPSVKCNIYQYDKLIFMREWDALG